LNITGCRFPAALVFCNGYIMVINNLHFLLALSISQACQSSQPPAPASIQRSASAFTIWRSSFTVEVASRKHRALRSFQICQQTSANKESRPRRCFPVVDRTQPAPPAKNCRLVAAAGCGSCRSC